MTGLIFFLLMIMQTQPNQEYVAKKGDIVTVTVWERESLSGTVVIDANGNITLPMPIGSIQVVGQTAMKISQMLTEKIKEYLVNPTVFISISPSEGFNVHVLGEVILPSFVQIPEGTTIQEVITKTGGFTPLADLNHIRIIRTEENIADGSKKSFETIIDFEIFIKQNDLSANPVLKSDDVLFIPRKPKPEEPEYKYIAFFGAVNKPGIIEVEDPLPLARAMALAGGISNLASAKDIYILSKSDKSVSRKNVDFEKFLKDGDYSANPIVNLGDMVFVPTKLEKEPPFSVNIVGQVVRPGKYPTVKGSRVMDAISEAGGFIDDAVIDKISIMRINSNNTTKETVNIKEYLTSGDLNSNPILMEGDTIFVPISQDAKVIPPIHQAFTPIIRITLIGEVNKPGVYQVSGNTNILDALKIAGGYSSAADIQKINIFRESVGSKENQKLQIDLQKALTKGEIQSLPNLVTGDMIFIPKSKETAWRTIVKTASEISTLATTIYLVIQVYRSK
jgi:protein involved in polysaccharide export with SLBB domain